MKIYRVLSNSEYKQFVEQKSIVDLDQSKFWFKKEQEYMLFPEYCDRFGKFFFFELEDLHQFVRYYNSWYDKEVILELDIDAETALKYLSFALYSYPDPTLTGYIFKSVDHYIPELFIDHEIIDDKIRRGDYRLIYPKQELQEFPRCIYEGNRNSKLVELGKFLKKATLAKTYYTSRLKAHDGTTDFSRAESLGINMHDFSEPVDLEKLIEVINELAIKIFMDFAREHEKYMKLVPVDDKQPM